MRDRLQVLMELNPCLWGFSGIPQETRMLFSYFHDIPSIQPTGLLNINNPNAPIFRHSALRHIIANQSSKLVLSAIKEKNNQFSFSEKLSIGARLYLAAVKNIFGIGSPLDFFTEQGFENFLWEQLFSASLNNTEFQAVTGSSFRTLEFSPGALHLLRRFSGRNLKIDTRGYNVLLVHEPFPAVVSNKTQLVIRYYDAIPLLLPHLIYDAKFHQASCYRALCSNAKRGIFVCSSHNTRDDLLNIFPKLEKRAHVINDMIPDAFFEESFDSISLTQLIQTYSYESRRYLGEEEKFDNEFFAKNLSSDALHYILMVSTIEPRKNHIRLIQAWERVCARTKLPLKLVLVGKLGWRIDSTLAIMKPWQQRGELFHLQKVPLEHLRLLYRGAACVVCPSVKEGFDLSGIEAMACGGLVIASDIPVHKEVYGDAVRYFDPYSFENQADVMELVVNHRIGYYANDEAKNQKDMFLRGVGLKQARKYQRASVVPQWTEFFELLHNQLMDK